MSTKIVAGFAVAAALAVSSSANAVSVVASAPNVLSVNLGGGVVDFDTPASVTTSPNTGPAQPSFSVGDATFNGPNGILMTGTTPNLYAEPFHDQTQYLTVQPNGPNENVTFGHTYSQLGLYWGSMDTYNSIQFFLNGNPVGTVTGSDAATAVAATALGLQTDDKNNRFITISGLFFNSIVLNSTGLSFELDNLSFGPAQEIGPTPLPGALPLFISGLGGLGFLRFWRKKKQTLKMAAA